MTQYFRDGLLEVLGTGVDLLFCNEQEAKTMAQTTDLNQAIEFLKQYAQSFVVTLGAKGALAFDGKNTIETPARSEEHTSELQSRPHLVCRLLLDKKNIESW